MTFELMPMDNRSNWAFSPPSFASNLVDVPTSLASVCGVQFPSPGTPEWSRMNRRRGELIHRNYGGGLAPSEAEELAWLQRESLAAVDRHYPLPPIDLEAISAIEERLAKSQRGPAE